jgi:hypothetical protein
MALQPKAHELHIVLLFVPFHPILPLNLGAMRVRFFCRRTEYSDYATLFN